MSSLDIIALVVTVLALAGFSAVFTLLFGSYSKSVVQNYKDGKNDTELITSFVNDKLNNKNVKKQRWAIVKRVVGSVIAAFVCIFFVLAVINKISGNSVVLGNKMLMVVASGSMSEKHPNNQYYLDGHDDQFPTYSIILLEKVNSPEELKQYDVIAYVNDKGVNIIHRIFRINSDGTYTTRGDANPDSDNDHPPFGRVIGKYTGKYLPTIGIFILFFQSYSGIATILAIIYCMLMIDNRNKAMNEAKNQRISALKQALNLDEVAGVDNLTVEYVETLYLNKFIYTFEPNGLVTEETREEILKNNPPPETDGVLQDKNKNSSGGDECNSSSGCGDECNSSSGGGDKGYSSGCEECENSSETEKNDG